MTDFHINKDFCFGRMIITLPEDYEITEQGGQWYKFYWGRSYIEHKKQTKLEYNHEVNKIKEQLQSVKHDGEDPSLKDAITLNNGDRILISWQYAINMDVYNMTAYAWRNGITYIFNSDDLDKDNLDVNIRTIKNILTNLHYRSMEEIPNTPGFCFENGFIADDGKNSSLDQYEEASIVFSLKSHPDVHFQIESRQKRLEKEDSLITRYENGKSNISSALRSALNTQVKILDKGKYNTKYLNGERICANVPVSDPDEKGNAQTFFWENQGIYLDVLRPFIRVTFRTGNGTSDPSSLSDDQAIDLYNQFINKIRPRPVNGVPLERW